MIILAILFIKEIRERGPLNFSIILQAGHYTVKCYGAQGGSSSANGNKLKSGGKGSYATGTMTIKGAGTTFWAYVGGKGSSSKAGPNLGGYNGGGRGGKDYGGVNPNGDDASGGGGGATDLRIDDNSIESRIIVAAGGSGAAYSSDGAPGGDITGYYASSNDFFKLSDEVDQTKGIITGLGGDGLSANFVTGSGGGGGWRGGTSTNDFAILNKSSYKAVSHSGSSYISGYSICKSNSRVTFDSGDMKSNYNIGDGEIVIEFDYLCSENCFECKNSTFCSKCFDGFLFYQDENGEKKCVSECPPQTFLIGKTCKNCDPNCKACSVTSTKCTSCKDGLKLSGNSCIENCEFGYFEVNNQCKKCDLPCNECSLSSDNCTSCINGYILYENKCISSCPKNKIHYNNECQSCGTNCNSCYPSPNVCTSCNDGFYLYNNECIETCPPTTVKFGKQCVECKSPCKTCESKYDFCLTCIDNFYFYENKCYAACPPNITIAIDTNKTCIKCQDQCKTCSSSTDHCTSCSEGYYLFGNACIQECSHLNDQENGIYYGKNNEKQECSVCNDNNCIDCSENYLICKECSPYYHINNGICVQDPPCELYEDESFYLLDKCDYTEKEVKYAYIYVLLAKFTKQINNDDNGGAVHIIDCGIQCNDTCFIDCISPSGCGGAIYVNNSFNMINNATFVNVLFLRCKALAGGAVFVYEKSTLYNVSFVECNFTYNEALTTRPIISDKNFMLGGSALFLFCRQSIVFNCTFILNKGSNGSIKIHGKFDDNSGLITLNENEKLISIHSCKFEKDKNSDSSIYYVNKNDRNSIEVMNCNFKGELKNKTHYIDAQLQNKKKLQIKSCIFENEDDNMVNFDLINNELSMKLDNSIGFMKNVNIKYVFVSIMAILIVVIGFIIQSLNKNESHDSIVELCENSSA